MTARKKKKISILGSTGSIGVNCLDVVRMFSDRFEVVGLAAGRNMVLLAEQVLEFRPRVVSVLGESEGDRLKTLLGSGCGPDIILGSQGASHVAFLNEADIVVSAIVGAAGLVPTWTAVKAGKHIALANKETLVMAGQLVMAEAAATGAVITPVDSEHSAIFQVLSGQRPSDIKRLILTASGGPFRNRKLSELSEVTPGQALAHPNWEMGAKISIDSATLMNKGLEAIEARWLFGLGWDKIAIQIHPQSIVHSMVEFIDGAVLAQMGIPDMRVPIAYALSYPERLPLKLPGLDLPQSSALTFEEPDFQRFPCLVAAMEAGKRGGDAPALLNAANEVAVQSFLDGDLAFTDIHRVVSTVLREDGGEPLVSIDQVVAADKKGRDRAVEAVKEFKRSS